LLFSQGVVFAVRGVFATHYSKSETLFIVLQSLETLQSTSHIYTTP